MTVITIPSFCPCLLQVRQMMVIFQSPLFSLYSVCLTPHFVFKKTNTSSHLTSPKSFSKKTKEKISAIKKLLKVFWSQMEPDVDYIIICYSLFCIPQPYSLGSVRPGTLCLWVTTIFSTSKIAWNIVGVHQSLFSERMKQTGKITTNLCCHWYAALICQVVWGFRTIKMLKELSQVSKE